MPKPRIVVTGDSEAAVAFGLLRLLMRAEDAPRGRAGILAAYRDCLAAVRGDAPATPPPLALPVTPEPGLPDEEEPAGEEDAAPHPPAPPLRRKPRRAR